MVKKFTPTNAAEEEAKGRIAFWLDVDDLEWLAQHCCYPDNAPPAQIERCSRISFRARAALHKAGLIADNQGE